MSKARPRKPKEYRVRFRFDDGDKELTEVEFELRLMMQHFALTQSDDPKLRDIGRRYLRTVAEHAVANRIANKIQRSGAGAKGAEARWATLSDITRIVESLAKKRDELGDPLRPAELWPELYSELERKGLRVEDLGDRYKFKGDEKTFDAFRRQVQRIRERLRQA